MMQQTAVCMCAGLLPNAHSMMHAHELASVPVNYAKTIITISSGLASLVSELITISVGPKHLMVLCCHR